MPARNSVLFFHQTVIHTQIADVNQNCSIRCCKKKSASSKSRFGHAPEPELYSSVVPRPPSTSRFIKFSWREALYCEGFTLPSPQSWRTEYRLSLTLPTQHILSNYPSAIWRPALNQFTQNYTAETQWPCLYFTKTVNDPKSINETLITRK